MSGNLDKVLKELQNRTTANRKKMEKESKEKEYLWLNSERF